MRQRVRSGQGGRGAEAASRPARHPDAEARRVRGPRADWQRRRGRLRHRLRPVRHPRLRGPCCRLPAEAVQSRTARGGAGPRARADGGEGKGARWPGRRRTSAADAARADPHPRSRRRARDPGRDHRLRRVAGRLRVGESRREGIPEGTDARRARGAPRQGRVRADSPAVYSQHRAAFEDRAGRQGYADRDPQRRHEAANQPFGLHAIERVVEMRTACIVVLLAATLGAQEFPRTRKLADNVYFYEHPDPTKQGVTANNLIVVTTEGVVVADGQGTVENVKDLVAAVAAVTPQPIKYVVVGSEHGDHIGGDTAFPETATFVVHPNSKAALERRIGRRAETVADKRILTLGGTEIDVLFLGRAHTGGDLEVYLPREKILFMSEVFSNRIFPSMANGYPSEWLEALKKAERMDVGQFVPAHTAMNGPALTNETEREWRGSLERVIAEGKRLHDAKVPVDDAPMRADFGEYAGWWRRSENAAGALKRVYMELDGELK